MRWLLKCRQRTHNARDEAVVRVTNDSSGVPNWIHPKTSKTTSSLGKNNNGEAAVQQLEEEIRVCKNMIKCTVCSDRPKEVVILKCYHLFCNPCIQRNLELRHRKCPACGTAFGQSDVRFVKI